MISSPTIVIMFVFCPKCGHEDENIALSGEQYFGRKLIFRCRECRDDDTQVPAIIKSLNELYRSGFSNWCQWDRENMGKLCMKITMRIDA